MKKCIGIVVMGILLFFSCKPQKSIQNQSSIAKKENPTQLGDTVRIANDELEYEVIIIDPGFNGWLASRAQRRGYYEQPYLEIKNQRWVTEWNIRARTPQRYGNLYLMEIDYRPQIDYGYEVNYLLYNYLVYFQQTNKQRLGGVVPEF
ncbi:DUF6146 family protein [Flavobacterium litorale]|uniref:Lipoprotein n=1 Tax=Flavobacterium litorale TaxID=2856519 RepID=A0ABX8V4D4_9FLAO|nr:DUF6146 family protein [Flavobacterium litorale]QYJ67694.1 hypothetical protein K1I41_09075 [Flavobacterium litorale]